MRLRHLVLAGMFGVTSYANAGPVAVAGWTLSSGSVSVLGMLDTRGLAAASDNFEAFRRMWNLNVTMGGRGSAGAGGAMLFSPNTYGDFTPFSIGPSASSDMAGGELGAPGASAGGAGNLALVKVGSSGGSMGSAAGGSGGGSAMSTGGLGAGSDGDVVTVYGSGGRSDHVTVQSSGGSSDAGRGSGGGEGGAGTGGFGSGGSGSADATDSGGGVTGAASGGASDDGDAAGGSADAGAGAGISVGDTITGWNPDPLFDSGDAPGLFAPLQVILLVDQRLDEIPEPAGGALLLAGLAGLLASRRRR